MSRPRLRELGIAIGHLPTGHFNAITDVPGVRVGHSTINHDIPGLARTGVTIIAPRPGYAWENRAFAGYHSFNGCGEMTGLLWVEESGMLSSDIALTGTFTVGTVQQAMVKYGVEHGFGGLLPVVAETYDGFLNDGPGFHVHESHVYEAYAALQSGPVAEGGVGGGTGMICHDFKGGIGTASRVAETKSGAFTVGVLVQANHGDRADLRINGVPVGLEIGPDFIPTLPHKMPIEAGSSIVIIVATDAPLLPFQCKRLARRATVGLSRTGSYGHNWSGDIFLAFTTGNNLPADMDSPAQAQMMPIAHMNPLFLAVAEATEEAIINALCAAEAMSGRNNHTVYAMPLEAVQKVMKQYDKTS